jgi:hypothetical protein
VEEKLRCSQSREKRVANKLKLSIKKRIVYLS